MLTEPSEGLPDRWTDATVVHTPLDLIIALHAPAAIVVLSGAFAVEPGICGFLRESYPNVDIVANVTFAHARHVRAVSAGPEHAVGFDPSGDASGGEHSDPVESRYS